MAKKNWLGIIAALKKMVAEFGEIWPGGSTKLSGYAESGPYFCGDCKFMKGVTEGQPVLGGDGRGYCNHEVVLADPEVKKDDGLASVNPKIGCCEFVDPPNGPKPKQQLVKLHGHSFHAGYKESK